MMQGIDETFAGAIFIGYHTGTSNLDGVARTHALEREAYRCRLKGVSVSEAGLNAAIAGHFNVPVIMVSGDDAVVKETTRTAGEHRRRRREMSFRFSFGDDDDAANVDRLDSRESRRAVRRIAIQTVQAGGANRVGRPFQELPCGRSAELSEHRPTTRFA
jgi:hypothetical protein